jgi:hypothetical protein
MPIHFQKGGQVDEIIVRELAMQKKGHIPGYAGFVRGSQHIAGATFGSTTREAKSSYGRSFQEINENVELPTSPHKTIRRDNFTAPKYQLPGYCGYLTGARDHFGQTFGSVTKQTQRTWGNTRLFDTVGNNMQLVRSGSFAQDESITVPNSFRSDAESFRSSFTNNNQSKKNNQPNKKRHEPPGQKPAFPTPKPYKGANIKEKFQTRRQKKEGIIPGYCGFVPHSQHVQGLTFSAMTRSVSSPDSSPAKQAWGGTTSMLPLEPHRTKALIKPNAAIPPPRHHLPGYTGHLAGARDKFSGTYGSTTSKLSDTQPTGWFSREYTAPSPQHIKNGR